MSRGRGLSNQDKQPQTAVPETAWQQTLRGATATPSWQVLEQQQVLDAAPRLARLSDLGTDMWHALQREAGQGKPPAPRLRDATTRQDVFSGSARLLLTWPQGACQPSAPLWKLGQAPPGGVNFPPLPSLLGRCAVSPGVWEEALLPYLLCRSWKIQERHLGTSPHFCFYYYQQQQKPQQPGISPLLWARHYARCLALIY